MDRDFGSKPGSGGAMSSQNEQVERRERLRKLALETVDLSKDPYFMKNHLGTYECKLCLTLHNNEGNYLAHTQGKRHQQNLGRRAAREAREAPTSIAPARNRIEPRKTIKIGRGLSGKNNTAIDPDDDDGLDAEEAFDRLGIARPNVTYDDGYPFPDGHVSVNAAKGGENGQGED